MSESISILGLMIKDHCKIEQLISELEEKWIDSLHDFILISKDFYQYH